MERRDPASLDEALGLLPEGGEVSPRCLEILAEAWGHYFHIRSMSWD